MGMSVFCYQKCEQSCLSRMLLTYREYLFKLGNLRPASRIQPAKQNQPARKPLHKLY